MNADVHACAVAGAILGLRGLDRHGQPLHFRRHAQLGVAHAYRGTPHVIQLPGWRAPPTRDEHRHVRVGRVFLGDGESQCRRARLQLHAPLLDQTLALHGYPRFRIRERRCEQHGGRIAHRVASRVRYDIHLEAALVVPGHPLLSRCPAVELGDAFPPTLIARAERHDVHSAGGRRNRTVGGFAPRHDGALRNRVHHPLAHQLRHAVALAVHLVPFAPRYRSAHVDARYAFAAGAHSDHSDRARFALGPEELLATRLRSDVERCRMHDHGGLRSADLAIHILHRCGKRDTRRASRSRFRKFHRQRRRAARIQRVHATRHHAHPAALVILPPPAALADEVAIGVGNIQRRGGDGG